MLRSTLVVALIFILAATDTTATTCTLNPLGPEKDDTDQILSSVQTCGVNGNIIFNHGTYNVTRKMSWNLVNTTVDLYGTLSFVPNVAYWLDAANTYRVVFIQNQASWFVITGSNFTIDAHSQGGIDGNGQTWWNYFTSHTRRDGDGRPIALTVSHASNAVIRNFEIFAPPFWCNTVADSKGIKYDGMKCNATNTNPTFAGQNIVPNTDGINTYRSDDIKLLDWDVTCGDDCLAIKGNSTNIYAHNIACRGGNGIAVGSLGQYVDLPDVVVNVTMENLSMIRLDKNIQPNMQNGVYLKTWTGTSNGLPPTAGGGGRGSVHNLTARNVRLDRVNAPVHLYQTNNGHSGDQPSKLQFSDLTFANWSGAANTNKIVDVECSSAAPCSNVLFSDFKVNPPSGSAPRYICQNVISESGLGAPCNSTGLPWERCSRFRKAESEQRRSTIGFQATSAVTFRDLCRNS